jgi:fucose 4-O-acetylase-like acetyltransferase
MLLQDPSRDTSRATIDVVKGILILVVVAGHNEAITHNCLWLRQVFYYFNVQCFLLLSSLLDTQPFTWPMIRDRAVRYLVPYAWFLAITWAAYVGLRHGAAGPDAALAALGRALVTGSEPAIHAATGMRYLWFLPALLSLVTLKSIAIRWPAIGRLLVATSLVWMAAATFVPPAILAALPLGVGTGLFFFGLGELLRAALARVPEGGRAAVTTAAVITTVVATAAIVTVPLGWVAGANVANYDVRSPVTWAVALVYPCAMLLALVAVAERLPAFALLRECGRLSLPIYLVHMLVYRCITLALYGREFDDLYVVGANLPLGIGIFIATVAASLAVSEFVWRVPRLKALVFPRTWADWRGSVARGAP